MLRAFERIGFLIKMFIQWLLIMKKKPTPRINRGFDHLTGAGMNQKAGAIYDGMFENPFFPTPVPNLESLNNSRLEFSQLLEKASSRSKDDIAARNVCSLG